ncbi:MAG TPA: hypothetical protein ENH02_08675 [Bacteroidetes bacterium]|nr:hypothetical protein [Bacteroidota bacterium]
MEDENFKKDLDELFHLFKKVVEKRDLNEVPGMDKFMLQQFQFFFSNYDQMKDQIADQLQGQFGDSIKEMVRSLVMQLREEVGDDEFLPEKEEPKPLVAIDETETDIVKIDEMLKNPDLTEEQVNELLDRRANLSSI